MAYAKKTTEEPDGPDSLKPEAEEVFDTLEPLTRKQHDAISTAEPKNGGTVFESVIWSGRPRSSTGF